MPSRVVLPRDWAGMIIVLACFLPGLPALAQVSRNLDSPEQTPLEATVAEQPPAQQTSRPNIVLILADDLGFTDIAPYGSEIRTPTLSALAENGIIFTNY